MADIDYIQIEKELIPYEFNIDLGERLYVFGVNYNSVGDFFTADLSYNGEKLATGEKIVLNQFLFREMFEDVNHNVDERYPTDMIMPLANDETIGSLGWYQLENNCFLYVVPRGDLSV